MTMSDESKLDPIDLRENLMVELAKRNYAVHYHPNDEDGGRIHVYVHELQTAGGELLAILSRHGYAPVAPIPYDSDDFAMKVTCEPANWQNWDEPSYDFINGVSDDE